MRMIKPTYADAINALVDNAEFKATDIDNIEWLNGTTPVATADIQTKLDELMAEYEASAYAIERRSAYPSVKEQLDMLWHAIDSGTLDTTSDFYTTLAAVKAQYPKPAE